MIKAYKQFWKKYFDFKGVSNRSEFWWNWLINSVIYLIFAVAFGGSAFISIITIGHLTKSVGIAAIIGVIVCIVYSIAAIIPFVTIHFRRYRDAGVTPWFLLITYGVPFILTSLDGYKHNVWLSLIVTILIIVNFIILVLPSKNK